MDINRYARIFNLRLSAMICSLILLRLPAFAGGAEDFRVLKISSQDQRAVIKMPGGKVQVIKEGDVLRFTGGELQVVEIAEWRAVLEEKKGGEKEIVIIRLDDGKQRVERVRKTGEKRPALLAPQPTQAGPAKDGKKKRNGFNQRKS